MNKNFDYCDWISVFISTRISDRFNYKCLIYTFLVESILVESIKSPI